MQDSDHLGSSKGTAENLAEAEYQADLWNAAVYWYGVGRPCGSSHLALQAEAMKKFADRQYVDRYFARISSSARKPQLASE